MNVVTDRQDHCVLTNATPIDPTTKGVSSCKEGLLQDLTPFPSTLGKLAQETRTIIHFIQALMRSPDHDTVGVLLCVSRPDEIRKLTKEMGLSDEDFAVFTADEELNSLGSGRPRSARVLFTTQQMVERRCEGKLFKDVEVFHFRGHPRSVRI